MRTLLVLHNAKDSGGIQAVCRLLASQAKKAGISKSVDLRRSTLKSSLLSNLTNLRFPRLIYLACLIIFYRPKVVICTHINQVRLLELIKYKESILLICHGGEVWTNPLIGIYEQKFKIIFLCVSDFTGNEIRNKYSINSQVIKRLHLTSELFTKVESNQTAQKKNNCINLLTVSRLEKTDRYKGVDSAIFAVHELINNFPQIVLTIIGTGDDLPYYRGLIQEKKLQKNIKLLGYVSFEKLIQEYLTSDLFLLPGRPSIRDDYSEGEGFGIVFIEAGYFGIPSIGGSGDGAGEAILNGVTGLLVEGNDLRSIKNGIEKLILNIDLRTEMSIAARKHALQNHSFEMFNSDLLKAIEVAHHLQ